MVPSFFILIIYFINWKSFHCFHIFLAYYTEFRNKWFSGHHPSTTSPDALYLFSLFAINILQFPGSNHCYYAGNMQHVDRLRKKIHWPSISFPGNFMRYLRILLWIIFTVARKSLLIYQTYFELYVGWSWGGIR